VYVANVGEEAVVGVEWERVLLLRRFLADDRALQRHRSIRNAEEFVDESLVGELCAHGGDHVHLSIDEDHLVNLWNGG
jgi:hypothetical protein